MGQKDLPLARAEKHAKAFERLGWTRAREAGRNPHIVLTKTGVNVTITLPAHKGQDVKRALLQRQLKLAGIPESLYVKAFKGEKVRQG